MGVGRKGHLNRESRRKSRSSSLHFNTSFAGCILNACPRGAKRKAAQGSRQCPAAAQPLHWALQVQQEEGCTRCKHLTRSAGTSTYPPSNVSVNITYFCRIYADRCGIFYTVCVVPLHLQRWCCSRAVTWQSNSTPLPDLKEAPLSDT